MIKKSEYVSKYVFWERGVTFYPPHKNCVLAISIRGKMNTKGQGRELYQLRYELKVMFTILPIDNSGPKRLLHFLPYKLRTTLYQCRFDNCP